MLRSFRKITASVLRRRAFTLPEIMVACAVLVVIMLFVAQIVDVVTKTWRDTMARTTAFADARSAFDRVNSTLSQAVLNTYWDYNSSSTPTAYKRQSELQFLTLPMSDFGGSFTSLRNPTHGVFFQAPTGRSNTHSDLPNLLNAWGYYIEFGSDTADRPGFLPPALGSVRYRYRLKEWRVPSESFALYKKTSGGSTYEGTASLDWINLSTIPSQTIAENVVALIMSPRGPRISSTAAGAPLTTRYAYNSRNDGSTTLDLTQKNQLPPEVEIIMVALDEPSATRWIGSATTPPADLATGLFQDPAALETDLGKLKQNLSSRGLRFVEMRSLVALRSARWNQTD